MFMWIRLEKDRLKSSYTIAQLRKTVSNMPTGLHRLHQAYERSVLAISQLQEESDRERAQNILRWALYASRPLSIQELSEALVIRDGMDDLPLEDIPESIDTRYIHERISALCGSLIVIRGPAENRAIAHSTVHLAHF
jgi:hypothetical protein